MHKFCSKKLFALVFCFILCLSLVLVACNNETTKDQPLQHEYTGDLISYVQETSQFQVYGSTTSYKDNNYYFEHTIPSQENDLCLNNTTKILDYLNCDKNISVTVFETNSYGENSFIDNNNIFTFRQDFNSAEYASLVVLSVFGKYCNYSLAYGYANYILYQVGLSDTSSTSLPALNNEYLYDMNVLCFSEQYADKDSVVEVKTFATALVNDYIDKHGENSFKLLSKKQATIPI